MIDKTNSQNALMESLQAAGLPVRSVVDGKPRYVGILTRSQQDAADLIVDGYNAGRLDYLDGRVYDKTIEDQLDMQYWDAINGTTTWRDYITAIKEASPKP